MERGSHQHPTPGRSGAPCAGPIFLPLCRLPRTLVSRPVLAPGPCGPLGEHFAGPSVPDLPRAALSSAGSGAACSVTSALGASPSGGPPACRPRRGCSVYLTPFPHLFPGKPQQGPGHCRRSGRSPGPQKEPATLLRVPRGRHPLTGPAQQALSPAAKSCGDGPSCPQDLPAHCPTSRPSHSPPWRSLPPQPHSHDTTSKKTSLISLPQMRGAGLKGPSFYYVGLPGDWSPSCSHPPRVTSSEQSRKFQGTWERVRNQGRDKHLFVTLSWSQQQPWARPWSPCPAPRIP